MNKNNKSGNSNKSLKTGFFTRLFDYVKSRNYNRKLEINQKYKVDWDKVKWRYRSIKLTTLCLFYFGCKYIFVSKTLKKRNSEIEKETHELKKKFDNYINEKVSKSEKSFEDNFLQIRKNSRSLLDLKEFNKSGSTGNNEVELIRKIVSHIKTLIENNKEISTDKTNIDILSLLKIINVTKLYDIYDPINETLPIISVGEKFYKQFLTGICIPDQAILVSTNTVEDYQKLEESVLIITMNILNYLLIEKTTDTIQKELKNFMNKILEKNLHSLNGKYIEDISLLIEDIKTKNIANIIILNPFLIIYFPNEHYQLLNSINQINIDRFVRLIDYSLSVLSDGGYNLDNLKEFNFNNLEYLLLEVEDENMVSKKKIETYLKKKLKEMENNSEINNSTTKDLSQILNMWNNLKV